MPTASRETRKQATRDRIAGCALRLFTDRGFDEVSVAEVAAAAEVTEKTVFNHFHSKADLVYSHQQEFGQQLSAAVTDREQELSPFAAVSRFLLDRYERFPNGPDLVQRHLTLARLVSQSASLRRHESAILARYAAALASALADDQGHQPNDLRPKVFAETVLAIHRVVIEELRAAALAGADPAVFGPAVAAQARRAFSYVGAGLDGHS